MRIAYTCLSYNCCYSSLTLGQACMQVSTSICPQRPQRAPLSESDESSDTSGTPGGGLRTRLLLSALRSPPSQS